MDSLSRLRMTSGHYLGCGITSASSSTAYFSVFVMIAWPYIYQGSLREITTLEKKLEDIRYKALFTSAALIEYERINNITTKVEQYQLQLVPATQPPYLLVDSGQYPTPQPR